MTPRHTRFERILLRLLPLAFRERHGASLVEDLATSLEGRSLAARAWLRFRTAVDVLYVAASLRLGIPRSRPPGYASTSTPSTPFRQSLIQGARALARAPGLAALIVLMVGLGVGASTVVFSVANTLLLRPLPFDRPADLVWISNGEWGRGQALSAISVQVGHLQNIQRESRTLQAAAGFHLFDRPGDHTLYGSGPPMRLTRLRVTPGFLPLLGVAPVHGRHFDGRETQFGGPAAILLSYDLWAQRFEADPEVVGRAVTIDDEPVTVVGVLPASFDFPAVFAPGTRVDYVAPFPLSAETNRTGNALALLGRMAPGATVDAVQNELDAIAARHEGELSNSFSPRALPLRNHVAGTFRSATVILGAAVTLVMVIVCANLSNLLLARGARRRRELAVRAALGAGRRVLVGQMLLESLILAAAGGALGIAVAYVGTGFLSRLHSTIPLLSEVRVDTVVLTFAAGASLLTGLVFGLLPALRTSLVSPYEAMRAGGRGHSTSRRDGRLRQTLVVVEVSLACLLVVGAGLLLRSFLRLAEVDLGFEPAHAVALRVDATTDFPSPEAELAYFDEVLRRARAVPGVAAAGLTDVLPVGFNRRWCIDAPAAAPTEASSCQDAVPYIRIVSEGYVDAMGITILSGRDINAEDHENASPVVLVNDVLAEQLWPGRDPLGQVIRIWDDVDRRVVGVTRAMRHLAPDQAPGAEIFFPIRQLLDDGHLHVVARAMPGVTLTTTLRAAVAAADPDIAVEAPTPIQTMLDGATSPRRLLLALVLGFAATAVVLASLGIYGVISYSVAQRRQELGIRMALGAARRSVRARVLAETARLAALGLLLGLLLAAALARLLESQLFGVTASDPPTFLAATLVLAAVSILAGYVPAYRASRVDPASVLATDT